MKHLFLIPPTRTCINIFRKLIRCRKKTRKDNIYYNNLLIAAKRMQYDNTGLHPQVTPDHHLGHDLFNSCHSHSLPLTRTHSRTHAPVPLKPRLPLPLPPSLLRRLVLLRSAVSLLAPGAGDQVLLIHLNLALTGTHIAFNTRLVHQRFQLFMFRLT